MIKIMTQTRERVYEIKYFPDGTLNMTDTFIQEQDATTPIVICWQFASVAEQVVIYNLVNFIKDKLHPSKLVLVLQYVPNARMDRVKRPSYEVHTLKYFTQFINDLKFDEVIVTDTHSPVTMTLLDRATELNVESLVTRIVSETAVEYMFFPDKGALDRYDYLLCRTPFYGVKDRKWETGEIIGYRVENPFHIPADIYTGKSILIVDDICSKGGTFYHAALALKQMGFKDIYLYVTHCENTVLQGEILEGDLIKKIFTTDSICTLQHPKITIRRV